VYESDLSSYRAPGQGCPPTDPSLGVVVPARNEEAHIDECLRALDRAARVARRPIDVVVVLDSCVDGTEAAAVATARSIGLSSRLHLVHTDARRVGTSRRVGVARLLAVLGSGDHWLATTDADSVVPPDWFVRQLSYRAAGVGVVVGTVHVDDWQDRTRLRPHYDKAYVGDQPPQADGHRHVHGANLSFTARAYQRSGGFSEVANDEDVRLVESFRSAGESVVWASDLSVATSVRRVGRAPFGFAAHLNQLARALDGVGAPEPSLELTR